MPKSFSEDSHAFDILFCRVLLSFSNSTENFSFWGGWTERLHDYLKCNNDSCWVVTGGFFKRRVRSFAHFQLIEKIVFPI